VRSRRRYEFDSDPYDFDPTETPRKEEPPRPERKVEFEAKAREKNKKFAARRKRNKIVGGPVGATTLEEHQAAPDDTPFAVSLVTKDIGGDS
jgi:hypothetical protein